jgi:hypothetical protein
MRILNPTTAKLAEAVAAMVTLTNIQTPEAGQVITEAADVAAYAEQKPGGFVELVGPGEPGDRVAAVTLAWYSRLDGARVYQLNGSTVTLTREGVAPVPALVKPKYLEQVIAAGGFPVVASERLSAVFTVLRRMKAASAEMPEGGDEVLAEPGDLKKWETLAASFSAMPGGDALAADIIKAIGA